MRAHGLQFRVELAHDGVRREVTRQEQLVLPRDCRRHDRHRLSRWVCQRDLFRVLPTEERLFWIGFVPDPPDLDWTAVVGRRRPLRVGDGRGGHGERQEFRERRGIYGAGDGRHVQIVDGPFELCGADVMAGQQRSKKTCAWARARSRSRDETHADHAVREESLVRLDLPDVDVAVHRRRHVEEVVRTLGDACADGSSVSFRSDQVHRLLVLTIGIDDAVSGDLAVGRAGRRNFAVNNVGRFGVGEFELAGLLKRWAGKQSKSSRRRPGYEQQNRPLTQCDLRLWSFVT